MATVTSAQLIEQARQLADMEAVAGESFVDDDEMLGYLNDAKADLDFKLLELKLLERPENVHLMPDDGLTLPSDYLATVRVYRLSSTGNRYPLRNTQVKGSDREGAPAAYRVINNTFEFWPCRNLLSGIQVEHVYVASFPSLALTAGVGVVTEVTYPNNWHRYLCLYAASLALAKEETVNQKIEVEIVKINERIDREATQLSGHDAFRIQDNSTRDGLRKFRQDLPFDEANWRWR